MKLFFLTLAAVLSPTILWAAEIDTKDLPGIYCEKPKALLYQEKDMNDFLDVTLLANHTEINSHNGWNAESPRSRAVIRVQNSEGVTEIFAGLLSSRGNSRKGSCATKPLRLEFLDPKISEEIESELAQANILPSSQDYLSSYHAALQKIDEARVKTAVPPTQGLFAKLGDDIKIVTHCGPNSLAFNNATEAKQNDHLRGEYYIYRILQTLKMPVESARGANFTYLNADGSPVFTSQNEQGENTHFRPGFFREPSKSIAKRCGLLNKSPLAPNTDEFHPDTRDQATFMNNLIYNSDWFANNHNVNTLWTPKGEKVLVIYDFDLSDIFRNGKFYPLQITDLKKEFAFAKVTLKHRAEIQALLERAHLEPDTQNKFFTWFRTEMDRLEKLVEPTQP